MRQRQVIIAKDMDVDFDALARHPMVIKCWRLPRGYTLFEYYHPVFERTWDCDVEAANAARRVEPYKSQTLAAEMEVRNMLAPLYRNYSGQQDYHMYVKCPRTVRYWFCGREKHTMKWPRIGCSTGWQDSPSIRIAGRLFVAMPETVEGIETVVSEWRDCLAGEIRRAGEFTFTGDSFRAEYDFAGPCGDATMALFMLLTATRNLTSLEAVGFFLAGDFSTRYRHPRAEGEEMPQSGW
jgi:hypothetical protein